MHDAGTMTTKYPSVLLLNLIAFSLVPTTVNAQQLRDTFRKVHQSVVVVKTKSVEIAPASGQTMAMIDGLGSGVLISDDGKILTAAHVVQTADVAYVQFADDQEIRARVIGSDIRSDVALLQLERIPKGVSPAKLGDSDKMEVGDEVFVIGAPYGIGQTLSVGHLSGRHRLNNSENASSVEFLQTDAAVNRGNSGGPMFDIDGNVIGIVSTMMSQSGGSEGLAFVTASNTAKRLLLEQKPFWSGIDGVVITGDLAKALNLPQPAGFLVMRVAEGSISSRLGIQPGTLRTTIQGTDILLGGDVILRINDIDIVAPSALDPLSGITSDENYEKVYNSIATLKTGATLVVTVFREGKVLKLTTAIDR